MDLILGGIVFITFIWLLVGVVSSALLRDYITYYHPDFRWKNWQYLLMILFGVITTAILSFYLLIRLIMSIPDFIKWLREDLE